MSVVVKHTGYISKGISQLKAHVKYIGFRSDEMLTKEIKEDLNLEKGRFFNDKKNSVDYREFIKRIESNKALKHQKSVKAHKFVFSLKEKDLDNYLKNSDEKTYRDLIRNTLDEYGRKTNQNLDWIAVEHVVEGNKQDGYKKSKHPHVHVLIKGVTKNNERVKFKVDDYKLMKDIFNKEFNKVCEFEKSKDFSKVNKIEKALFDKTNKVIKSVQKAVEVDFIEKQQERRRIKREQYKDKGKERERIK